MENLSFDRARKIWKRVVNSPNRGNFSFELEVSKRLLDLFHVGPFYYYIFNCGTGEFEYVDEKATDMLGYALEDISTVYLIDKLHPEDVSYFLNFESTITDFYINLPVEKRMSYKTSYDIRFRIQDGQYVRVLQQVTPVQVDADGSVFRTLGVHTDITNIKPEGDPVLNIIGLQGEPSYYNVQPHTIFEPVKPILTRREREIVKLIVEGYNTGMIAEALSISPLTVKTHRRNILAKTQTNSALALAKEAIAHGWV